MADSFAQKQEVFVCGAGHQGISMAAHLSLNGCAVTLWNRTSKNIEEIAETGAIRCSGCVSGIARIARVTGDMSVACGKLVMVATPSTAHKDIARSLAPFLNQDSVVVLNPGRTFGAVEFAEELRMAGVSELPHIAEAQTIVYTCRRNGAAGAEIHALKEGVRISSIRHDDLNLIMQALPDCLRDYFEPVDSVAVTSLGNVGMILHCAPVLMNVGWIEASDVDFKYYYHGISPSIAGFLEMLDKERLSVAKELGFEVESTAGWMRRVYGIEGDDIYSCIQNNCAYNTIDAPETIRCRYLLEDIPNGLVPASLLGRDLGVSTPCTDAVVFLGSRILGIDFFETGRHFSPEVLRRYI